MDKTLGFQPNVEGSIPSIRSMCRYGIVAITTAFQAVNVGSIPTTYSIGNIKFPKSLPFPFHNMIYESQTANCFYLSNSR